MGDGKNSSLSAADLRSRAEKQSNAKTAKADVPLSLTEARRLLHELQVHQIELEMQNEELLRVQEDLAVSRNNYSELYDFAPVGYFIFDSCGMIREVNLTGAQLLGIERSLLVSRPFAGFISDEGGRPHFADTLRLVLQHKIRLRGRIGIQEKDGVTSHGRPPSVTFDINHHSGYILTTLFDCTVRKQLEESLQKAHDRLEITVGERTRELTRTNMQPTQGIGERRKA